MNQASAVLPVARGEPDNCWRCGALEGDDLVGPECPVGEVLEAGAAGALDELILADGAGVHAAAAERNIRTAVDCGREHAFEVVVAVGSLLADERAGDCVGEQEDPDVFTVALGE
jgi:hypothetical protein